MKALLRKYTKVILKHLCLYQWQATQRHHVRHLHDLVPEVAIQSYNPIAILYLECHGDLLRCFLPKYWDEVGRSWDEVGTKLLLRLTIAV